MATIDTNFFMVLHGLAGKSGVSDGIVIFTADYLQYVLVFLFLVFLFVKVFPASKWRVFWTGVISIIISRGIVTTAIRYFYHRPRPFIAFDFQPLIPESDFSFPSGHMAFFFALSAVIFYFNKKWGWWFFTASAVMGIARIIAGVHWPTDILGGMVIGIAVGYLTAMLISSKRIIPNKKLFSNSQEFENR